MKKIMNKKMRMSLMAGEKGCIIFRCRYVDWIKDEFLSFDSLHFVFPGLG